MDYSTNKITNQLIEEIKSALDNLDWGSIEIYVQNSEVVQITRRQIKKTSGVKKAGKSSNYSLTNKQH